MVAQQLPQGSLWFFDPNAFNPALLTSENQQVISANIRSQWAGFDGAPRTQSLNYVGQVNPLGYFGVGVMNDQAGAFARRGLNLSYTQIVILSEKTSLRAGLRVGLLQASFDESQMSIIQADDPAVTGQKYTALHPAVTPAVALVTNDWTFGLALPYAFESEFLISNTPLREQNRWRRHLQGSVGKAFELNDSFRLEPSLWVMGAPASDILWALNLNAVIQNRFIVGGAYRNNSDLALVLGVNVGALRFAYSYDLISTDISSVAMGSHDVGIIFTLSSKFADSDGDGIADDKDECPDIFGTVRGCPDSDGDGIPDKDDLCPDEYGLAQFGGCPDTDGDGVPDKSDKCPELFGLPEFDGCPDSDGDGIPDHLDKCPQTHGGEGSEDGCPTLTSAQKLTIEQAFGNLEFESGKATIKENSLTFLVKLAMLMRENPTWRIELAGHTDSVGDAQSNLELSKNRVEAVASFLVSLDIAKDRIISSFYGQSKPIDANDTAEGRAKNRRVEMNFVFD